MEGCCGDASCLMAATVCACPVCVYVFGGFCVCMYWRAATVCACFVCVCVGLCVCMCWGSATECVRPVWRVPGLPIRDCARGCNNCVHTRAQMSAIDVIKKILFERLYLVSEMGTFEP